MCLHARSWGLRASRGSFVSQGKHQPVRYTKVRVYLIPGQKSPEKIRVKQLFVLHAICNSVRQGKKASYSSINLRFLTQESAEG